MTKYIYSDLELLSLLKEGDHLAFNELYNRFNGLLFAFAYKLTQSEFEAEDIVQDIFVMLWEKRERVNISGDLSPYLYSAVRYNFLNIIDRRKVREAYQESFKAFANAGVFITDEQVRERELIRLINAEIAKLPPKMREVFEMSRHNNISQKEIAEKLSLSKNTVKKQIDKARRILKVKLGTVASLFSMFF